MTLSRRFALVAFASVVVSSPVLADGLMTGGIPLAVTNTTVGTNVAAGIGNNAGQAMTTSQSAAPMLRLDFSGRGPMVTTNVAVGTNVAAGLGNAAAQRFGSLQR